MQNISTQIQNAARSNIIAGDSIPMETKKKNLVSLAKSTVFKDFSISDGNGKTYNDTDISDRDYFIEAMKGKTYISSPIIRKTDGSLTIMVGTPIEIDGKSYSKRFGNDRGNNSDGKGSSYRRVERKIVGCKTKRNKKGFNTKK